MSQSRSHEAQVLAVRLDVLRARAQQLATEFDDLAFAQVATLLEVARVTMVNHARSDQATRADVDTEIEAALDRARWLEGTGRSQLQRVVGG